MRELDPTAGEPADENRCDADRLTDRAAKDVEAALSQLPPSLRAEVLKNALARQQDAEARQKIEYEVANPLQEILRAWDDGRYANEEFVGMIRTLWTRGKRCLPERVQT
jgi:hypothetical protein